MERFPRIQLYSQCVELSHILGNDRDQFLQPDKPLSEEFMNDCLVWMLFSGSNLTASADDLEWNSKTWSILNHFIPYIEEVGANSHFESDFLVNYMQGKNYSDEALAVLAEGKKVWQAYFALSFPHSIHEKFKLGRADLGLCQIRKALKALDETGEYVKAVSFDSFEGAYATLTEKLRSKVYEMGFLRV